MTAPPSGPTGGWSAPAYLFTVKSPAESHGPWDYYKLLATSPVEQSWRPLAAGGCGLIHA